jgi:tRNA (guanine37-N1)-methyltransferase
MIIDVITLFPKMFSGFLEESVVKRAQKKGIVNINLHNLRDFSEDKHKKVDDRPYGGGPGMVLSLQPIVKAFEYLERTNKTKSCKIVLTPDGKIFSQSKARQLSKKERLIILCGHYEGFDQRIFNMIKFDDVISIGKYVLTGGELPAMVVMDATIRLIPGVLGNPLSCEEESFMKGNIVDYPQYTRPAEFRGERVPEILLSGNHQGIKRWRELKKK